MDWTAFTSSATAIGVVLVLIQLRYRVALARTRFEDSINEQYRAIIKDVPVDALIGQDVSPDQWTRAREMIYNYLDLSNEQIFLRSKRRVRKYPWVDWSEGIKQNLSRPAVDRVWQEVKQAAPDTFSSLERLEVEGFSTDPAKW